MISVNISPTYLTLKKKSLYCNSGKRLIQRNTEFITSIFCQLAQSHEKQDLFLASYFAPPIFLCCFVFVEHKYSVLKLDEHTVCSCLDVQKKCDYMHSLQENVNFKWIGTQQQCPKKYKKT